MPLSPKITASIPPQTFETIIVRIAEILAVELARQWTLDNNYPKVKAVWVERFTAFDTPTELPAVNVNFSKGTYANQNPVKSDGTYTFNIDVYTGAQSTQTSGSIQWADKKALLEMTKIMGMIRAILSAPAWVCLGFDPGKIGHMQVRDIRVADRSTMANALAEVIGRVTFDVVALETNELQTSVPLEIANTVVKISDSEQGFKIELETA